MGDVTGFAFIGCGYIADKHARALRGLPNARLVAVCDTNPSRASSFAACHDVRGFTNFHTMMQEVGREIDVVTVLTPTGHHVQNVLETIAYRKHIVVEKPLVLTPR